MIQYDVYIREFLISTGSVSLEGIGILKTSGAQIEFEENKRAATTPELITFISEKENKSFVLIESGLDAHVIEMRQFINLGKPWHIEGVGMIQLGKKWQYELIPQPISEEPETKRRKTVTDIGDDIYYEPKRRNNFSFIVVLIILIIAGGIGYTLYDHFSSEHTITANQATDTAAIADTITKPPVTIAQNLPANSNDSVSKKPASVDSASSPLFMDNNHDTATYKFVFERTFDSVRAYKRFAQLKSYYIRVRIDSVQRDSMKLYKLYILKKAVSSDTARLRDSLQIYLGSRVSIEGIR